MKTLVYTIFFMLIACTPVNTLNNNLTPKIENTEPVLIFVKEQISTESDALRILGEPTKKEITLNGIRWIYNGVNLKVNIPNYEAFYKLIENNKNIEITLCFNDLKALVAYYAVDIRNKDI